MRFSCYNPGEFRLCGSFKDPDRAGEIVQWLRSLIDFADDLGSVPSTHMVAHNLLKLSQVPDDLTLSSGFQRFLHVLYI